MCSRTELRTCRCRRGYVWNMASKICFMIEDHAYDNGKQFMVRRMPSSGLLRRVALVRTDVSEELSASFIRVTSIGELGTLAATSNRRTLRRNTFLG
jgi:hypothetical protein